MAPVPEVRARLPGGLGDRDALPQRDGRRDRQGDHRRRPAGRAEGRAEPGILTQAWSPIGGITFYPGFGEERKNVLQDPTIGALAAAYGKTPAQVMLRWQLQQGRSAIPKSTNPSRIAENLAVFDFDLTAEQLSSIEALDTGVRGGPDPDLPREAFDKVIPED